MEYILKMMCEDFKFTWFKLLTIHKQDVMPLTLLIPQWKKKKKKQH